MDATPPTAWQPLTLRGVAAFARAPLRRLFLVQFIAALLVAMAMAWLLCDAYFPPTSKAIAALPAAGEIRNGRLAWQGASPVVLAENRFLAWSVDLEHSQQLRSVAHLQIELSRTNFFVHSLFGYVPVNYPAGWIIAANRTELQPLWGAWQPALVAGVLVAVWLGLLVTWWALATLATLPIWLLGYYLNRDLSLVGSWKLAGAALLPGALLMVGAVSFYDLGVTDLVQLGFVFLAHILVGWIYFFGSPFVLPQLSKVAPRPRNPFRSAKN